MKPNKMNKRLVKTITKKAIEQIQENPEREIRNLIDMGSLFAKGKFQKQFFQAAERELAKKNSPYYKIATHMIQKTDKDNLLTFGMNLGYNSLTYGAAAIREFEENAGFNIPWVLFVALSAGEQLDTELLNKLISQGEELGICSYVLILSSDYSDLEELAEVIAAHGGCAFLLLIEPDIELDDIDDLADLKNILIGVNISHHNLEETKNITKRLRDASIFCSAFYRASGAQQAEIENAAKLAASLEYELVLILHDDSFFIENHAAIEKTVNDMRLNINMPVIPFDLLADVVMVDRNISSEGCFAVVSENGDLSITNIETKAQNKDYNIMTRSLKEIFHRTLPKGQDSEAL